MLQVFATVETTAARLAEIRRLLDTAFGGRLTDDDWDHALGGWHAVVSAGGEIVSHGAVVPRVLEVGERRLRAGYVEAVATRPDRRGRGAGSRVMAALDRVIHREFELGALSTSAHGFYARLGWERWRGPTYVRAGADLVRTEDEDDGVMVLRFGPSRDLDLTTAIACPRRTGDDW